MAVIAVSNRKGGSGKTSLCIGLTGHMRQRGLRVTLIDTDSEEHLSGWHARAGGWGSTLISEFGYKRLPTIIRDAEANSDVVIVDTAGVDAAVGQAAINMADLVLTPVKPSGFDSRLAGEIAETIASSEIQLKRAIYHAVILMEGANTKACRHTKQVLQERDLPLLDIEIPAATEMKECSWSGDYPKTGTIGLRFRKLVEYLTAQNIVPRKSRFKEAA
jgi:chromosome partitioning protein